MPIPATHPRATRRIANGSLLLLIFLNLHSRLALADVGIAARYPGDKNIASDPAVIFADDFESYTSSAELTNKWDAAYRQQNIRIATEAGNFFAGSKAVEFSLPVSTTEVSNGLEKHLTPDRDIVFIRAYTKFDPDYSVPTSNHNGLTLSAKYPGPGTKAPADGTGFFLFLLQNNIVGNPGPGESAPGYAHLYAYWPKQRSSFGDHWYPDGIVKPVASPMGNQGDWLAFPNEYPDFKVMPNFLPERDRWYCYELMVRANTPGLADGEVKYWIDGKLIGDFPDLNIRSLSTLKIDEAHLSLHAMHSERVNKKWYDNVVIATQYIGPMVSASATPSPTPKAQLQNISSRLMIQTGNNVAIAGFVIGGTDPKRLLIRGLGPTLAQFNINNAMQNPTLELHDGSGSLIATNDNWQDTQQADIAATQLAPPAEAEAAILATLPPGSYTAIEKGVGGGTGVGLIEIYDLDPPGTSNLVNISTRGLVETGNNALIAGCSIAGESGSNAVLLRALGPSLSALGVSNALPDPVITLCDGNGNVMAANDNWKDSQRSAIENTGLQPPGDGDAAILATLPGGNYTAIVTDKNGSSGVGLVEVYAMP